MKPSYTYQLNERITDVELSIYTADGTKLGFKTTVDKEILDLTTTEVEQFIEEEFDDVLAEL